MSDPAYVNGNGDSSAGRMPGEPRPWRRPMGRPRKVEADTELTLQICENGNCHLVPVIITDTKQCLGRCSVSKPMRGK